MIDRIGGLIIDIPGRILTSEDQELLRHPLVGGVILFTRNYESRAQLDALCKAIRAVRTTPLLITVDQEGGRVQRFIPEFTRLPPAAQFGQIYDKNPDEALHSVKECAWLLAMELLSLGIDLSFAPVLDLNIGISSVIGTRAFHEQPEVVVRLAAAFVLGMQEAGMAATGKHFPGHGSVQTDSHIGRPIDERAFDEVEKSDLQAFVGLIRAKIPAIMASHLIFPAVDERPVGFSRKWLQDILRMQLGFQGVVFSDDLTMEGANISTYYPDRVVAAREAGCDFALLCNNRQGVIASLDNVDAAQHQVSMEKFNLVRARFDRQEAYQQMERWQTINNYLQRMHATA